MTDEEIQKLQLDMENNLRNHLGYEQFKEFNNMLYGIPICNQGDVWKRGVIFQTKKDKVIFSYEDKRPR